MCSHTSTVGEMIEMSLILASGCLGQVSERYLNPPNPLICLFFGGGTAPYGGFQARAPIGAVAAGLHHSHSNTEPELHLPPTPQLMTMSDPRPTEWGQGSNLRPHGT